MRSILETLSTFFLSPIVDSTVYIWTYATTQGLKAGSFTISLHSIVVDTVKHFLRFTIYCSYSYEYIPYSQSTSTVRRFLCVHNMAHMCISQYQSLEVDNFATHIRLCGDTMNNEIHPSIFQSILLLLLFVTPIHLTL